MTIRLNKVTRDLNVGISTVVEFLQKKGHTIEANPNTKITEEEYDILVKEFSTDKNLRIESERFIHERQSKDRNKASVSIDGYESRKKEKAKESEMIKTVIPDDSRPHFKPVGKIDLNNLGKGPISADKQKTDPVQEEKKETLVVPVEEDKIEAVEKKEEPTPKTIPVELKKESEVIEKSEIVEKTSSAEPIQLQPPVEKSEPVVEKKEEIKKEAVKTEIESTPEVKENVKPAVKQEIKTVEKKGIEPEMRKIEPEIKEVKKEEKVTPIHKEEDKKPELEKEDEIYTIRDESVKPKLNIIGQIDLATLNQSTRPKKKTKEEKRKEREEKEKIRLDQKKQMKEAIIKEIRKDDSKIVKPVVSTDNNVAANNKKKRNRINNEKVDINKVSSFSHGPNNNDRTGFRGNSGTGSNSGNTSGNNTQHSGNNTQRTGNQQSDAARRNRYRKPIVKAVVSEVDVAKQVKETLARLTNKGKNKTSKYRKEKRELASNRQQELKNEERKDSKIIKLTEFVTANELATMMDVSVNKVISTCMSIGIMVSINQRLDAETINMVAEEFGYKTEYVSAEVAQAVVEEKDSEEDLVSRAPIVTVMGHVDHGKTSLLDYIRKANVIAGEAGGITQHIGAYNVKLDDGRRITFLDTPGHEAFTAMRARGAKATDIAIIIVAADDHVMPQTKEAINHAMAANVPIVFAINKIDKPGANPEKIKEELANMNFLVEEWGGKYQSQDISAKKGIGVKELMEKVLLEADILELKANPDRKATGSIIESALDKGRGYIATVLVSNGTLKVGDIVLAGTSFGRVKAMFNERNQRFKEAGPSDPALILGLNGAPQAGDTFHVIDTEQEARDLANKREQLQREQGLRTQKILTLDELGRRIALGEFKELNIVIKGDVDGSIEALRDSLIKLSTEKIQVNIIHAAVGEISESDVTLAAASDAIIVGFQVRPSAIARRYAEQEGVDIRLYSVIYAAIEEVKSAMEGMLAPEVKEIITSTIEVREVFHITKVGTVAGSMVKEGKVKRSDKARVVRDGIVIFTGAINALKRFKDDVKEVPVNFECGISLVNYNDLKEGDIIETYEEVEVKKTL